MTVHRVRSSARRFWVAVGPHMVAGRYRIDGWEGDVYATTAALARSDAVLAAHVRAGVPPWLPWLRESWPFTVALEQPPPTPVGKQTVMEV